VSKLTVSALIAIGIVLILTGVAFIATLGAELSDPSTGARVNPTQMMEHAPPNLPVERHEAN
jgi:hypothetical protein